MSSQLVGAHFVLVLTLLVQAHGDNHGESRDISWLMNATQNLAAYAEATQASIFDLRERFQIDVAASTANVIDRLDTLGVMPGQLLVLQGHVLEASSTTDDLLDGVHSRLINYRALAAHVNEHLISKGTAQKHDLAQLMEDTGVLIALMDSSLDLVFSRYDFLREIALDLAHSFSGQDVEEIEDLLNNTDDILVVSYTSLTLNKFALESQYHDTVFALQSVISQMALIY